MARAKLFISSSNGRAAKRRRLDTGDEEEIQAPATPSRAGRHSMSNGTSSKKSGARAASSANRGRAIRVEVAESEEGEDNAVDDEDETRRPSRQRKPSTKLLDIQKDQEASSTPKPVTKRSLSQPARPVTSTSPQRRTPGRPRKSLPEIASERQNGIKTSSKGKQRDRESGPELSPALPAVRKRGRPSVKERVEEPAPQTPRKNNKTVTFSTTKSREQPEMLTNGHVEEDIEMLDLEFQDFQSEDVAKTAQTATAAFQKVKYNFPFTELRSIVLQKLNQRRAIPLVDLDDEYAKVHTLLEATVTAGESNSMVLVGARASGKKSLVNKALLELSRSQRDYFHVIRLNGFIQTDDKLALREIWRQLGKEMDVDEDVNKSYADTLTMLLAILSHPEEITGEAVEGVAKSTIFIMDEFDLFATHSRQTLLYNLLDIAQSRKAPIAVLGLTTKFDVSERLEKRVKSRFSHRYVYLPLPRSTVAFQSIVKAALSIEASELSVEEALPIVKQTRGQKSTSSSHSEILEAWNQAVSALLNDQGFISTYIRPVYHLTKSIPTVLTSLIIPLSTLSAPTSSSTTVLPADHFLVCKTPPLLAPTSTLTLILPSLSELQLSLLIAAARLDVIHDSDTCSFGMAYAEYVELASKARLASTAAGALASGAGTRVWGRNVAKGEWETLIRYGLLVPTTEASGSGAVASVGGLVRIDVKLEEIPGAVPSISSMMERWCRQI